MIMQINSDKKGSQYGWRRILRWDRQRYG